VQGLVPLGLVISDWMVACTAPDPLCELQSE
jgi:hypothetical protein